jgi:hypothetical protein
MCGEECGAAAGESWQAGVKGGGRMWRLFLSIISSVTCLSLPTVHTVVRCMYTVVRCMYTVVRCMYTVVRCMYTVVRCMYTVVWCVHTVVRCVHRLTQEAKELQILLHRDVLCERSGIRQCLS